MNKFNYPLRPCDFRPSCLVSDQALDESPELETTSTDPSDFLAPLDDEPISVRLARAEEYLDRAVIARIPWYAKVWCWIIRRPLV